MTIGGSTPISQTPAAGSNGCVDDRDAAIAVASSNLESPRSVADPDPGGDQSSYDALRVPVASALLKVAAVALDDIERIRIAAGNRLEAWDRSPDAGGMGLPAHLPEQERAAAIHAALAAAEHLAELELKRALRQHPLGAWVKDTVGIGEKQGARLIAAIGDPFWNARDGRPRRGPAELWAYCGFDVRNGQAPRRRKGERANWNGEARMRTRLVAETCIMHDGKPDKNGKPRSESPYRAVYDRTRATWSDRDTTDLHKHNHALRVVAKEILKDLWMQARGVHGHSGSHIQRDPARELEEDSGHGHGDSHRTSARSSALAVAA